MPEPTLVLTGAWAETKEKAARGRFRVGKRLQLWLCRTPKQRFDAGFRGIDTQPRRRAVARQRARPAAGLRAVEEFASLSQLASGEVGAYLHRGSALWATPSRRIRGRVRASL